MEKYDYFDDELCFFLVNTDVISVYNMTDQQIKQSIVDDILNVMFTLERKSIKRSEIYRFIDKDDFLVQYVDMLLDELIDTDLIKIVDLEIVTIEKHKYQTAMDFCGTWYEGYTVPDGVEVFGLSDKSKELIELNGFDNFVNSVLDEFAAKMNGSLVDNDKASIN